MIKLSYLILLILCAVSPRKVLASSDDDDESSSSVSKSRQKRMNHFSTLNHDENQNHPGAIPRMGQLSPINEVNIKEPTMVEILFNDGWIAPGFAIHPFYVLTRPGNVQGFFNVKLTVGDKSHVCEEYHTYVNLPEDVAVVRLATAMFLAKPKLRALENHRFTEAAVIFALGIVRNHLRLLNYQMQVIRGSWQTESSASVLRRILIHPEEIPPLGYASTVNEVQLKEPTIVEIIVNRTTVLPGFAINPFFVVTRAQYVLGYYRVKLTQGDRYEAYDIYTRYTNLADDVAVVRVKSGITLAKPRLHALENFHYSDAAVNYALGVVQEWMQENRYPMKVIRGR